MAPLFIGFGRNGFLLAVALYLPSFCCADIELQPAPWRLKGDARVVMLDSNGVTEHLDDFIPARSAIAPMDSYSGLFMLVHYRESPVGPYFPAGAFYSITKIYVSSEASVLNGQRNWGIPKEWAAFSMDDKRNEEVTEVKDMNGHSIATMSFSTNDRFPWSFVQSLYFSSRILPEFLKRNLQLVQHWQGREKS